MTFRAYSDVELTLEEARLKNLISKPTSGPISRRHHTTSLFYLSHFTEDGHHDSKLWITDTSRKTQFSSKPLNVGIQNNFYTVEGNLRPDQIEASLGILESHAAPVINAIVKKGELPSDDLDFNYLMNFLSLLAVRTEKARHLTQQLFNEAYGRFLTIKAGADRKRVEELKTIGEKFISGEFSAHLHQNDLVTSMLKQAGLVGEYLWKRNWHLISSDDQDCGFITSDNPVALFWRNPEVKGIPGFALNNTIVTVPISSRFVLVGTFEDEEIQNAIPVTRESVAQINSRTIKASSRFIYSHTEKYTWLTARQEMVTSRCYR